MEQIYVASLAHFHRVRLLLRTAHQRFVDFGSEDLAKLLAEGVVVVGEAEQRPWGALIVQREPRSPALPPAAQGRAMLRGVVLARGRSPSRDVRALLAQALPALATDQPLQLVAYATAAWLPQPLLDAGFELQDRLLFFELARLQRRMLSPVPDPPAAVHLRPATPEDIDELVVLDAASFAPLWHLGTQELMTLLLAGRIELAVQADRIVGYTAMTLQSGNVAHLARLAVHPDAQRLGLGQLLLHDAVHYARKNMADAVMLNTQGANRRAQSLYMTFGFRATGKIVPVFTLSLNHTS